jgi:catechol 2,3-dioxygenase-like lactoylglutathione lyase family enzyme
MELKYHSVVVFVKDIETARDFYLDVLEQEIEYDFGKNIAFKSGISLWEITRGHLIENSGSHCQTDSTKAYELYFETEDIDKIQIEVAEQRLSILHDLIEEPWGQRTIRFYDPDNNLIEVGETMEAFVKRFSESGMTPEQISVKTTIPVEIVRQMVQ